MLPSKAAWGLVGEQTVSLQGDGTLLCLLFLPRLATFNAFCTGNGRK